MHEHRPRTTRRALLADGIAAAALALAPRGGHAQAPRRLFDTHVHAIVNDPSRYPLGPEFGGLPPDIFDISPTAERLLQWMDANGVDRAALVQHDPVYGDDNSYIADAARRYPRRLVAIGRLGAGHPEVVATMRHWVRQRGLSGIRVHGPGGLGPGGMIGGGAWISDQATLPVWETAVALRIPVLLLVSADNRAESLQALGRVLQAEPRLRVLLDHMADYRVGPEVPESVPADLLEAARQPNLYVKVSTHNLRRLALNGGSTRAAIRQLVAAFGAERLVWGSDVGNTRTPYDQMIAQAREAFADLSDRDRSRLQFDNANRLLGRQLPSSGL